MIYFLSLVQIVVSTFFVYNGADFIGFLLGVSAGTVWGAMGYVTFRN